MDLNIKLDLSDYLKKTNQLKTKLNNVDKNPRVLKHIGMLLVSTAKLNIDEAHDGRLSKNTLTKFNIYYIYH